MRRGVKHQNQFQIVYSDFSGGLNTSTSIDTIADNQLAVASNVEVDHATGNLRTVAGTITVRKISDIFAALHDAINNKLLIIKSDKKVYVFDFETKKVSKSLGTLTGDLYPIATSWEDGLLIASGGKLQYYNGEKLKTLENSPTATSVYVRAGRILVTDKNSIHYSSVGDEETWLADTDDESSGIFVEAGYKDGGELLAMVNLSQDVLMIKNNRRVYRLSGEFPNWQMNEVSRNIEVSGRLSICSVADSVYILGRNEVQHLQTTSDYGDVKPENVAMLITSEIQILQENALLRFLPPLRQIWAIQGDVALVFDLVTNSWFKRKFNSPVVDVISVGTKVFVIKADQIATIKENTFSDSGHKLHWKWQGKRLVSHYDYFLKCVSVSFSPTNLVYKGQIRVGSVIVDLPEGEKLFGRRRFILSKSPPIYGNLEEIFDNETPIFDWSSIVAENHNVFRSKFLDVMGNGNKGGQVFHSVKLDLVEV